MNSRSAMIIGLAMSLCVAMGARGQITLTEANPTYTYDATKSEDNNLSLSHLTYINWGNDAGYGYSPTHGLYSGPESGIQYQSALSYTFQSGDADQGIVIEKLWVYMPLQNMGDPLVSVYFSYTPEGGSTTVPFLVHGPNSGPWGGILGGIGGLELDVNAPSVTITFTVNYAFPKDDSQNWLIDHHWYTVFFNSGSMWASDREQGVFSATATFADVPEPMTMSLLAVGGVALLRRRRGR